MDLASGIGFLFGTHTIADGNDTVYRFALACALRNARPYQ